MEMSFGVRSTAPPSFSCSLLVFLGRSPAENREALNNRGERLFCRTLIVRVVSASLFNPCVPLRMYVKMIVCCVITCDQSSKIKLA